MYKSLYTSGTHYLSIYVSLVIGWAGIPDNMISPKNQ